MWKSEGRESSLDRSVYKFIKTFLIIKPTICTSLLADISGTKRRHILELKLRNWKLTVRLTISGTCIGALMT
jgi:hypothetical protein